jgi:hypothetical protein
MAEKPAKPTRKRVTSPRTKTGAERMVEHDEIAERAYYIHLDDGNNDALDNWLRAERELTAA